MGKPATITPGEQFNYWTVIEKAPSRNGNQYVLCQCKCGTLKEVCFSDIRKGKSKSCGCIKKGSRREDLLNQTFGRLTVIKDAGVNAQKSALWECECRCGNHIIVRTSDLKNGHTQSCGCLQRERTSESCTINLVGQVFNGIEVLSKDIKKASDGHVKWICKCHCGKIFSAIGRDLKNGHIRSCGCISYSIGEKTIEQILNDNNISFIREYKFPDLIFEDTNKFARFDFLVENKYIIEYDGKQHFEKGTGIYDNEVKFKLNQEHDKIKNKYCFDNNIPIIRIPYIYLPHLTIKDLKLETSRFIVKPEEP